MTRRRAERHPRITPQRALTLLIELTRRFPEQARPYPVDRVCAALEEHVRNALAKAGRR